MTDVLAEAFDIVTTGSAERGAPAPSTPRNVPYRTGAPNASVAALQ